MSSALCRLLDFLCVSMQRESNLCLAPSVINRGHPGEKKKNLRMCMWQRESCIVKQEWHLVWTLNPIGHWPKIYTHINTHRSRCHDTSVFPETTTDNCVCPRVAITASHKPCGQPAWLRLKVPREVHRLCARVVVCHCCAYTCKIQTAVEVFLNCQMARWHFEGHEQLATAFWPKVGKAAGLKVKVAWSPTPARRHHQISQLTVQV